MKESPEPTPKKLKQARLPFQIISPDVKNPVATSPLTRKRKASENEVVNRTVDIKENHVTPPEKKSKLIDEDDAKEANEEKNSQTAESECMDVDEKVIDSDNKRKGKKNKTPSVNIRKKNSKTTISEKKNVKNAGKRKNKKADTEKTEQSNSGNKEIVDLTDSPCKETAASLKSKNEDHDEKTEEKEQAEKDNDKKEANVHRKVADKISAEEEDLAEKTKTEIAVKQGKDMIINDSEESKEECNEKKSDSLNNAQNAVSTKSSRKHDIKQNTLKDIFTKQSAKSDSVNSTNNEDNLREENLSETNCKTPSMKKQQESSPVQGETSKMECSQSSIDSTSLCSSPSTMNNSVTSADVSISSSVGTPTSAKKLLKKTQKTPGKMTPKQILKMKEKEERNKERKRLQQEKERKKAEEREEKLKKKLEKEKQKQEKEEEKKKEKEEKEKQRLEKEEEKRREKEEKEKKKQADLEQKNEEKRLKEEEKRLKEEERKKKEEEEKKKKEEKRLMEEQKEAVKRKSAQAFASFFVKSESKSTLNADEDLETSQVESYFQPFEVKADMRLAPVRREELNEERRQLLTSVIDSACDNPSPPPRLYLEKVRSPSYTPGTHPRTWAPPDITDDDVIIIESEKPNEEMEVDVNETIKKSEKKRQRPKLLQFHENRRPPYWGTWRKKSRSIRPRAPLNQDKVFFEYDVDSDDEWEEPEDGESLRGSEDEESQDEQYEEDDMFVPHGYLSDEEGQDELDDTSPDAMKAKLKLLQLEFEAERSEKQEKLRPRLIGCVWFCNSESDPTSAGSVIAEMFLSRRAVWEGALPIVNTPAVQTSPSTPVENGETEETKGTRRKVVHKSLMPFIIKKIHGNRRNLRKLIHEILEEQPDPTLKPSKKCLVDKIREIATWAKIDEIGHHSWIVKEEVLVAYDLKDLNISPVAPTLSSPANITKFTKVLTSEERLNLLREVPVNSSAEKDSVSPPVCPPTVKPSVVGNKTPSIKLATPGRPKKRAALISVPRGPSSLLNFVTAKAKLAADATTNAGKTEQESGDKVKKRITPITLPAVSKPTPPQPSEAECIIVED